MPAARVELIDARDWYERGPGMGRRSRDEVDIRLRRFPYGLFFRPSQDAIYVIACFHSGRDPAMWQSRA